MDPMGWLARAENFFEVLNVTARERLKLAFMREASVLGSVFGERTPRILLGKSFPEC